jgi:NADH-dependent peroxiredoxin subunit F
MSESTAPVAPSESEQDLFDVAVVGGGPAGLVAARYCLHADLRTAVLTPELGGKVNYPFAVKGLEGTDVVWGAQLVHQFETAVAADPKLHHVPMQANHIARLENGDFRLSFQGRDDLYARSVIVATGAAPQRLYIAGEKEYWGRGLSFSAISHAPFFHGRSVAVVGGGQRALIATLELAPIASHIFLIMARPQAMSEFPAFEQVRKLTNVTSFIDWEVQQVYGDEFVTGLALVGANGETRQLAVDGVFIQFSLLPNNELVRDLVELDHYGRIIVNQRCETSVPGLFAAGDVTNIDAEQVVVAVGEGGKAALSAWKYLATNRR